MSIRRKMLLFIFGILMVFCAGMFVLSRTVMMDGYLDLEKRGVEQDLNRVQKGVSSYLDVLDTTIFDWAAWDDAYEFVQRKNINFVENNLVDNIFDETGFRLNFIIFLDTQQRIVFQKGYDWQTREAVDVPKGILGHLTNEGLAPDKPAKGFVTLPEGLCVVVSRPILTSEEQGPPMGQLLMGRRFDEAELRRLSDQLELPLTMFAVGSGSVPSAFQEAYAQIASGEANWISAQGDRMISGVISLHDIYKQPAVLVRVSQPRAIYQRGLDSADSILGAVAATGILLALVLFFALDYFILAPLKVMRADVLRIEGMHDLSVRVQVQKADELGDLARAMNAMLEKLDVAEREMVRLERLSALGEMAAGINHNLNNILVGVTVGSEFLLKRVQDNESVEYAQTINRAGKQAAELVARLQDAVLGDSDEGVLHTLNTIVRESVETARTRWKDEADLKGIEIKVLLDLADHLPEIRGSSSGLYNILLNLIFNAVDAMPQGGELEIQTRQVGEGVQISVRDTGIGMNEETLKRVFEPFFTTKVEIGTGLGLATVYNTVVRWGGRVDVDSVQGAGSVFTLWFPAGDKAVVAPGQTERIVSSTGNILVVDDQDVIVQLVEHVLTPTHRVTCLKESEQVLPTLQNGGYDVVVLDLGMPGIPGDKIAEEIRRDFPEIALVLMTGWRLEEGDARLALFDLKLQKPLHDMEQVQDVVAQAVNLSLDRRKELMDI